MDLANVSTAQLVEELSRRQTAERIFVGPYEDYRIVAGDRELTGSGPVVLLRVWD